MAMGTEPRFPVSIDAGQLTASVSGTLFTAGANGSRVDHFFISSTGTGSLTATVSVDAVPVAAISIPAGAGTVIGVPCKNILDLTILPFLGSDGKWYLKAGSVITVTASNSLLSFHIVAGQY